MLFYSVDSSNPAIPEFKKLVNILLIESLVEELQNISSRIILYGSCAQGTDNSKSDAEKVFLTEVEKGITLWESSAGES